MAYKVLKTFDVACADPYITIEGSAHQLSNPEKIKLWKADGTGCTLAEYFRAAESFFTPENIRQNPQIFTNYRADASSCTSFCNKLLEKIPATDLKFLFCYTIYSEYGGNILDQRYAPAWQNNTLWCHSGNSHRIDINSESFWDGLKLYIASVKDFCTGSTYNLVKDKPLDNSSTYLVGNQFVHMERLLLNNKYIRRYTTLERGGHTAGTCRPNEAMEAISLNPSACGLHYFEDMWVLVCPINAANKSSLYQVFVASQDVTQILGKGTAKTKIVKRGDKEHKVITTRSARLLGVEVELCSSLPVRDMIDKQGDEIFFLCKSDASITGSKANRYECVTKPMSLSDHRINWSRFFSKVDDKSVFDVSTDTNNGMHVHIGKDNFTTEHLNNFTWFITNPAHHEFILLLSQRTADSFQRWCPTPNFSQHRKAREAFKSCVQAAGQLRGAVNVGARTKSTVEVRIFKGIVSCAEILRNLEVVDAIFEFTQQANYFQLTIRDFYNWVRSTPRTQYKLLRADLFKLEMDKIIRRAEVYRLCFGIDDPEKIVDTVNKHKMKTEKLKADQRFEIDTLVYTTVTKMIGRRVFGMSDEGLLTVSVKNTGRLAHMDQKVQDSYAKAR